MLVEQGAPAFRFENLLLLRFERTSGSSTYSHNNDIHDTDYQFHDLLRNGLQDADVLSNKIKPDIFQRSYKDNNWLVLAQTGYLVAKPHHSW